MVSPCILLFSVDFAFNRVLHLGMLGGWMIRLSRDERDDDSCAISIQELRHDSGNPAKLSTERLSAGVRRMGYLGVEKRG